MIKEANYLSYLGYKLFGERIRKERHKYYYLEKSLRQAMISMPPEMYIASAQMISLIFGLIGAAVGLLTAYLIVEIVGLPEVIIPISLPQPLYTFWMVYRPWVIAGFLAILITVVLYYVGYLLFKIYPSTVISDRKSKINRILPHAITYMYSLSRGGMNLVEIFRSLAENHEVYGEVSVEFARIIRDMELLGKDLRTALSDAIDLSPSENLSEFFHGLITIIDSGGDVTRYFEERAEFYLERAKQDQKNFLEFLGLMAESYITAFVAGPLFLIIIQTVMVVMGQGNDIALYAIIYLVIPVGSFFFAMVIKLLTPIEEGEAPELRESFGVKKKTNRIEGYEDAIKSFHKKLKSWNLKKTLKNPLKPVRRKPVYSFIFSIPVGALFMLYGFLQFPYRLGMDFISWFFFFDDYLFISLIIIFLPFVIFYEAGRRKIKTALRLTPVFLNKLASANESGMPIYRAITMIAKTDTSPLRKNIAKIKSDLDWGISLNDALVRFANRLKIFELSRTITLLNEALKSTGNVTEVLMVSAKDASNAELMRRERLTNMFMYVIIVYISFFVFIGIVYIISTTFLSTLAESAAKVAESGASYAMLQGINAETYKNIFMHASIFQGIFAGIVAGVMGEGSISSGIKHSLIMLVVAYLLFTIFI
ncbi:type II secretion protein F [Archaeoglobales archaeon]|nr:MAG: type II secretion protein F [Archaeoglobales archaeon]